MVCLISLFLFSSFYDDYSSALRTANRIFHVDSKSFSHAQQSEKLNEAAFYQIFRHSYVWPEANAKKAIGPENMHCPSEEGRLAEGHVTGTEHLLLWFAQST